MLTRRTVLMLACAMLLPANSSLAAEHEIKPPIRGLVSMGAFRFLATGGDPVNTLAPLDAKAGIFGGLVVIATWKQLQPTAKHRHRPCAGRGPRLQREKPRQATRGQAAGVGGIAAPDWAMHIGGAPIHTVHNGKQRMIGRFGAPPIDRRGRDSSISLPPNTTRGRSSGRCR